MIFPCHAAVDVPTIDEIIGNLSHPSPDIARRLYQNAASILHEVSMFITLVMKAFKLQDAGPGFKAQVLDESFGMLIYHGLSHVVDMIDSWPCVNPSKIT